MDAARAGLIGAAALALALAAGAGERLRSPEPWEAFFGGVTARVPAGADRAELYAGRRRVAVQTPSAGHVAFRLALQPGRYDLRIRFEHGARLVRRDESRDVWLLPESAEQVRRARTTDVRLALALGRLGRSFDGYAAFWVHDLTTGRTAGWNADARFPAASTVKLAVLIAALRRFGPRPELSPAWPDIRDLAVWSSNVASNRLLVRLGGSETGGTRIAQAVLDRIGARSSTFTGNYRLGTAVTADDPRPPPFLAYRHTTAHDLGRILFELHATAVGNGLARRRSGLSRHLARVALGLLLSSSPTGENLGLLRPFLPPALPMVQKQGWTTALRHTAAILYEPRGPKIVVVLTYRRGLAPAEARTLGARLAELL